MNRLAMGIGSQPLTRLYDSLRAESINWLLISKIWIMREDMLFVTEPCCNLVRGAYT